MKKLEIMKNMNGAFRKIGFQVKKCSPELLVVAGIVGTVTGTVMACKATTKVSRILNETKVTVERIHECKEDQELKDQYTEEDSKKDLTIVYVQTGLKLAKLYAPSVIIGFVSIGSILLSNRILKTRGMAIATAYATLDKSYKEYRKRVVERFGEEVENELRYNIKAVEIQETVTDEKGKEKTTKRTAQVAELSKYSDYARYYEQTNRMWESSMDYNLMYLNQVQATANDRLRGNGFLFLNDVYDDLGLDKTVAGQYVGWIYDAKNPTGDNVVEIKRQIVEVKNERGGYDKAIILDFNVDGNILNQNIMAEI